MSTQIDLTFQVTDLACLSSKSPPLAATGRPANLPATSRGLRGSNHSPNDHK